MSLREVSRNEVKDDKDIMANFSWLWLDNIIIGENVRSLTILFLKIQKDLSAYLCYNQRNFMEMIGLCSNSSWRDKMVMVDFYPLNRV